MRHSEQKYKVEAFVPILDLLEKFGAKKLARNITHHYYAQQPGNDVTKLVIYADRSEIHELKEADGSFKLLQRIAVADKDTGIAWLHDHGFDDIQHIIMDSTDYEHDGGLVGLYTINDTLLSVIIDFPIARHEEITKLLGLDSAERIDVPYNVYLSQNST